MTVPRSLPIACLMILLAQAGGVEAAGSEEVLEPVLVVAPLGVTREPDRMPADAQQASADQIDRLQALDLTDFLNRSFGSINISHAQNNPLQPDFNFRGFTASPLLGLPQGLSVYQNGVRINEPFGDTVSWDLIASSAIQDVQLLAGANPVFGLNTLGGALTLRMKDGFSYQRSAAEVYAGSFSRLGATVQSGGNNGRWGYYVNADYFEEDGWRDFSASDAIRVFGVMSYREGESNLDLSASHVSSDLVGNGASPVELLEIDRSAVFTHPDRTRNTLTSLVLEASTRFAGGWKLDGNAYFRDLDSDAFNGDGTIFDECDVEADEFLCEEGDEGEGVLVLDQHGNPILSGFDGEELNAINNISRRKQEAYGASVQASLSSLVLGGYRNDLTIGAAFSDGETSFDAVVEVASLTEDRSTTRTGIFAAEFRTQVDSDLDTASLYFIDTLDLTGQLSLTLGGRYDDTRVRLEDRTGQSPELNGSHGFSRFNPSVGLSWRLSGATTLYTSWAQSARAPTAVELACASEDAPCSLPNAFLADPPLDQVVANSFELGAGGSLARGLKWHGGVFMTTNRDDILFQTTGGAQANVGFFDNVADTRRAGIELRLGQRLDRLEWRAQYTYLRATFEDDFTANSPNHPAFEDDPTAPEIVGDGKLLVSKGSEIPGLPRHLLNAGLDFHLTDRLSIGADASYRSGVHLRGDEANLLDRTGGYVVAGLRGEYRIRNSVRLFARIENLFDTDYESFGLLGEPVEVFPDFQDPRFLGAGPPRGAWVGVRINML
jgi:iron complex outermembrane recepter protein